MAEERVRIEIAFDGGQIMGANVELSAPMPSSGRSTTAATARWRWRPRTGATPSPLRRVVYLKRFSREGRVGFTG